MTGTYLAPAKINLGLEVLYKRPDGYHELNTLFLRVEEPHDTITVSPSGAFLLTSSNAALSGDTANIVYRAAEEFCHEVVEPLPRLHVHLSKKIPMGAGLGGGSSDAAIMLSILNDWYVSNGHSAVSDEELSKLALKLGADVPFFLSGARVAQAGGIGEKLEPIRTRFEASVMIVVDPHIHVSTKNAYAALHTEAHYPRVDYRALFAANVPISKWKETLGNDFEPAIFGQFPQLGHSKHALYARGATFALMSGSGSALYGLFQNEGAAAAAKAAFEKEGLAVFLS
ncbi:MAG TPA: 4-(cytidine 5'-diphospho)-2-C-methyl-D-erythritol kinase [Candidatus Kapabacteria bacterium]|jgi:4-diphosphocytidyl-2-C-methyl-D-erythritol kinase